MNSVITANPALIRVNLTDQPASIRFEITNTSQLTLPLRLAVFDVGGTSHTSIPWAYGAILSPQYGLQRWMTVDTPQILLRPGETVPVTATIHPDSTMPAGGHYGSIVAALSGTSDTPTAQVGIQGRLSVLVFATNGTGREALTLSKVTVDRQLWGWPKSVSLDFANTGTVDLIPHGKITITGPKDTGSNTVINPDSQPVFPENSHTYLAQIPPARYWPAQYHLTVGYQAGQTVTGSHELALLVIPPWFLIAGSALLLLLLRTFIHKRRRR